MIMKRLLTLLILGLMTLNLSAQDIHYTQYNNAPLTLNPAFTGAFYGTFRIGGLYRSQFFNVQGWDNAFQTPSIYIDAPIIKGFRDQDWVGVGVNIFQDQAGSLELTSGSFMGNVAYHLGLNKDATSTISFGVNLGFVSRTTGQGVQPLLPDDPTEMLENQNQSYFDLGAGVMYRGQASENALIEAGITAAHLTGPRYNIVAGRDTRLPLRINGHARLKYYMSNEFHLTPSILFMTQNGREQLSLQTVAGMVVDPKREIEVNAGLGYRVNELGSLQLLGGLDWGLFKASFGYDLGLSSESFAGGQQPGAVEFTASYIARIYKKKDPKPAIFCPRF